MPICRLLWLSVCFLSFLTHDIDVGDIINQVRIPIHEDDTFGDIHDKLMLLGGSLVLQTVDSIIEGQIVTKPQAAFVQNESQLKPAPKLFRETCRINWNQDAVAIHNFIRGLSPVPTAWTIMQGAEGKEETVKIFRARPLSSDSSLQPGTIISDGKSKLSVATKDGTIEILELQLAGKKRMAASDFLRGFKIQQYSRFA